GTLDEALARRTGRNADLRPLAVFFDLAHANARIWPPAGRLLRGLSRLPAAAAVLVLLPLLAWRRRRPAAACAVAATGFSGMLLSMSLLFAFQALYGCVYLWIGVLSAAFMAGAGAAGLLSRAAGKRAFLLSEAAVLGACLLLPAAVSGLAGMSGPWLKACFLLLCLLCGAAVGAQFPVACRLNILTPSALYGWDLLGGWAGAVFGGIVLLPAAGLTAACLAAAALKAATFAAGAASLEAA
ncbi:MAG: spermine synthase, partial [Elusimicrobia bacterium]|nr:spermine synthase [Elusimicrobiota bacterium]